MPYSISISQFVKYWLADTSTKKRTVALSLLNQPGGAPYYRDFNSVIQEYVRTGQTDDSLFERTIQELRNRQTEEEYERARINHNIRVLSLAVRRTPFVFRENVEIMPNYSFPRIRLEDLEDIDMEISLAPDFVYTYTYRRREYIGALKLYYAEPPLLERHANFITSLIKYFLNTNYPEKNIRDCDCRLYDINTGREYTAPQAIHQRLEQIKEDCRDIYSKIERSI